MTTPSWTRRDLLQRTGLAGLAATLPFGCGSQGPPVIASPRAGHDARFLFVFNSGGWDPTRTIAPAFDNPLIATEADAQPAQVGMVPFADHPDRPSVRQLMEEYGRSMLVLNGMQVPGITHLTCTRLALTGDHTGTKADWAARLAAARADLHPLPYLLIGGTAFPAEHAALTARVGKNGLLPALLDGRVMMDGDLQAGALPIEQRSLVDAYVAERAEALVAQARTEGGLRRADALAESLARIDWLQAEASSNALDGGTDTFEAQLQVALNSFERDLCRCAMVHFPESRLSRYWDTHEGNTEDQHILWEDLARGLVGLFRELEARPGRSRTRMIDEVVVVVLSEMGRTPQENHLGGKDHWPWTSAILMGPGVEPGRVVGAYDQNWNGMRLDLASGMPYDRGDVLKIDNLGATLAVLADLDPQDLGIAADPIGGALL